MTEITAQEFIASNRNGGLLSPAQFGLLMRAGDYGRAAQTYLDFSFDPSHTLDVFGERCTNYTMLELGKSYQRFAVTLVFLAFPELRESKHSEQKQVLGIHVVGTGA